jgi:hypothetical protein
MVNNQTLKFLLPLITKHNAGYYLNSNFVGSFIGDSNNEDLDGNLLLVYKYPRTVEWFTFEDNLRKLDEFKGDYDYADKGYVIYIFDIDKYNEEFKNVVNGTYSEISPESKLKIAKFWATHGKSKLVDKILNKDQELLKQWYAWKKNPKEYCSKDELWYIPDIDEEIFNKDKDYE